MRRSIFMVFLILLSVGIVAAGFAWQRRQSESVTPMPIACQMIDVQGTPNIQLELAVDTLYEAMPQMKTPVAMVSTPQKPFTVGCVEPGD